MKRAVLFLATNLAIVLVLSVSMRVLGVEPWLNEQGLNLTAQLIFAAAMGFGGSFLSTARLWSAPARAARRSRADPDQCSAAGSGLDRPDAAHPQPPRHRMAK